MGAGRRMIAAENAPSSPTRSRRWSRRRPGRRPLATGASGAARGDRAAGGGRRPGEIRHPSDQRRRSSPTGRPAPTAFSIRGLIPRQITVADAVLTAPRSWSPAAGRPQYRRRCPKGDDGGDKAIVEIVRTIDQGGCHRTPSDRLTGLETRPAGLSARLSDAPHGRHSDQLPGGIAGPTDLGGVAAARMAQEDFDGAKRGIKVELVVAAHRMKPGLALAMARRWLDAEDVGAMTDISGTGLRKPPLQDVRGARPRPYRAEGRPSRAASARHRIRVPAAPRLHVADRMPMRPGAMRLSVPVVQRCRRTQF